MTLVALYQSVTSVAGWEYEDIPGHWNSLTPLGIPSTAIDGINHLRYTTVTPLSADDYTINGRMGEYRSS
jgi:hypothetical protein